jgi:acylphosphatase
MKQQIHLYISGDVQGIGLRYSLAQRARLLLLAGWVRNLDSGQVEAIICGEEENIKDVLDWLPSYASIKNIEVKKEKITKQLNNFEIRF